MKVCILGSGSSGNCIYINSQDTSILIDAGLSGKEICKRLRQIGINPSSLAAVVLSHEHTDHIQGIRGLYHTHKLPIFANLATKKVVEDKFERIKVSDVFKTGHNFCVGNFYLETFSVSHDAVDPVGFNIFAEDCKVSIATDLGYVTHLVKERLKQSNLIALESNYDPEMLINGPYPWEIKQRIKGNKGHLSNIQCEDLLKEIVDEKTSHIVLAHISETNNLYDLAHLTIKKGLEDYGIDKAIDLTIGWQDRCGDILELRD
ncbi:MAG: MBL fold metallo-hydrolase [bacterium]